MNPGNVRRWIFQYPMTAGLLLASIGNAPAANLPPGASATVNAGDAPQTWLLDAASLAVLPGGQTLTILTQAGSNVSLDGATVSGGSGRALTVTESIATIRNSTLTSTGNMGLAVVANLVPVNPSVVTVENSTIAGIGRGLNVSGGSKASVSGSTINGSGTGPGGVAGDGLGISLVGGEAVLQDSSATGSNRGAGLFMSRGQVPDSRLVLNHSSLTSQTGSAIVVNNLSTEAMNAQIEVNAGSSLNAANGTLLEVGLPGMPAGAVARAHFSVDASNLTGNVQVMQGAIADVTLSNGAVLNGDLNNVNSLALQASTVNGNVNQPVASTATVALSAGSVFNGNVNEVGSLSLDASQFNGNVLSSAPSSTTLSLRNQSVLSGNVHNAASITLDASSLTGNVQVMQGAIADVTLSNGAVLNGDLNNVNSLALQASTVNGNVNQPVASTATVALSAGSVFNGNVNEVGSLSLDASQFNGNVLSSPTSSTTLSLRNQSVLSGNVRNAASITLDASSLNGNLIQDTSQSSGALSLANGSHLTGAVSTMQSTTLDASSTFDMLEDSSVGALQLNGGTINLRAGGGAFRTLSASSLTGGGTFALGTDLAGYVGDLVDVEGTAEGSYGLAIKNTGVEPQRDDQALRVVHTQGGPANFKVLSDNGLVDVGTYSYQLEQRGTDWYLAQVRGEDPVVSPGTQTAIALFSAAPTVWYGELTTLRSRMGELRQGNGQGGFWARTYGNAYRVSATDQVHYQQNQQGISFGVDTPLPSQGSQWLIGLMGGYSDSSLNMGQGSDGRVDSYYVGVYSTWLADNGYYVDAVLKANRFANKADVRMSSGEKSKGDYHSTGIGASLEAGRHISLQDGWFVEPYAQLATLWVGNEDYRLDNGLQASSDKADSVLGKLGTSLGRTYPLPQGGFVQPYVKVAVAHEFARNNDVKVNNTKFHDDLSGSRGEIGAGLIAQLTDVLQLHTDIEYSNGKNIEQPWGANIGFRFAW